MKTSSKQNKKVYTDPALAEMYEIRAKLNAQVQSMSPSDETKFFRDRVAQYKAEQKC